MGSLELKVGDLFRADADAIAHGVNTRGAMASGIAVVFREEYPDMHEYYVKMCDEFGRKLAGRTYLYFSDRSVHETAYTWVLNVFSQVNPGADARRDLIVEGLEEGFFKLWAEQELDSPHIAIPLIGCGVGGLDWETEVYPDLEVLMARLPEGWKLTVYSQTPRERFLEV